MLFTDNLHHYEQVENGEVYMQLRKEKVRYPTAFMPFTAVCAEAHCRKSIRTTITTSHYPESSK